MFTPSSPSSSATSLPYQAYKSKRHSRNLSNSNSHLLPDQSLPKLSPGIDTSVFFLQPPNFDGGEDVTHNKHTSPRISEMTTPRSFLVSQDQPPSPSLNNESINYITNTIPGKNTVNDSTPTADPQILVAVPLQLPSTSHLAPKKASTFRRLQPRNFRSAQPPAPNPNISGSSTPPTPSSKGQQNIDIEIPHISPVISSVSSIPAPSHAPHSSEQPLEVLSADESLSRAISSSAVFEGDTTTFERPTRPSLSSSRKPTPYRPGFQPKGVYRPLTDGFIAARRSIRDGDGDGGMKRIERTKLERRLEKLISLHFPHHDVTQGAKEGQEARLDHGTLGKDKRRASIFDFQSLRNFDINGAGDLWRGVVAGGLGDTTKTDIRAAEQRITPWQDDAAVSKCPLCFVVLSNFYSTAFHSLTNRKHHCRLCGQIICSLPVKHPQRNVTCSTLFLITTETREIEEVGEGVDYGVKRRRIHNRQEEGHEEDDKFLKGVRICRECRPIVLKQQYYQQTYTRPSFVKLYENFTGLEANIEDSLPKFQELLMSLNHHDQPTKEASAARKRLLHSFAQYDKLSKQIRTLPCPKGPGSSQDRVQAAIMTRANLFLQKNMFPLQSLTVQQPGLKVPGPSGSPNIADLDISNTSLDVDSNLSHKLQPLLEQEILLEAFVAEAQMQRKFEDVKTLKSNLAEIRREIQRLLEGKQQALNPV